VVEAHDNEAAVAFQRDAVGMPEKAAFQGDGEARVVILDAGRATLEIANPARKRMIDEVEVCRQVSPRPRLAFEVDDVNDRTARLTAAGSPRPETSRPSHDLDAVLARAGDVSAATCEVWLPVVPREAPPRARPPSRAPRRREDSGPRCERCGGLLLDVEPIMTAKG
jgi:hypothetical protein